MGIAPAYLELLGGAEKIKSMVEEAVSRINREIDIIVGNDMTHWVTGSGAGRVLGGIFEHHIAEVLGNFDSNFQFRQGTEGKEKDFTCVSCSKYLDEKFEPILGDIYNPANYGIELKTSKYNRPEGNKSYAADAKNVNSKKCKDSFYIMITKRTHDHVTHRISDDYNVYFGFIQQHDWRPAESGSSSSIYPHIWNSDRIIRIR